MKQSVIIIISICIIMSFCVLSSSASSSFVGEIVSNNTDSIITFSDSRLYDAFGDQGGDYTPSFSVSYYVYNTVFVYEGVYPRVRVYFPEIAEYGQVNNFTFDLSFPKSSSSVDTFFLPDTLFVGSSSGSLLGSTVKTYNTFVDEFTGYSYYDISVNYVAENGFYLPQDIYIEFDLYLPPAAVFSDIAYFNSVVCISSPDYNLVQDTDTYLVSLIDSLSGSVGSIESSLTDVSPELQSAIDTFNSNMKNDMQNNEDLGTGLGGIENSLDSLLGTPLDDVDGFVNEGNVLTIGDSFLGFFNNLFDHWFFVSLFSLFGALVLFSRVVFG